MYLYFQKIFHLLYIIVPRLTSTKLGQRCCCNQNANSSSQNTLALKIYIQNTYYIGGQYFDLLFYSFPRIIVPIFGLRFFRAQIFCSITCVCEQYISKFETMTGTGRATVRTPPRAQRAPTNIPRYVFGTQCKNLLGFDDQHQGVPKKHFF